MFSNLAGQDVDYPIIYKTPLPKAAHRVLIQVIKQQVRTGSLFKDDYIQAEDIGESNPEASDKYPRHQTCLASVNWLHVWLQRESGLNLNSFHLCACTYESDFVVQ